MNSREATPYPGESSNKEAETSGDYSNLLANPDYPRRLQNLEHKAKEEMLAETNKSPDGDWEKEHKKEENLAAAMEALYDQRMESRQRADPLPQSAGALKASLIDKGDKVVHLNRAVFIEKDGGLEKSQTKSHLSTKK